MLAAHQSSVCRHALVCVARQTDTCPYMPTAQRILTRCTYLKLVAICFNIPSSGRCWWLFMLLSTAHLVAMLSNS